MFRLFCFVLTVLASPFNSKSRLEAENAVLWNQLIVLWRKVQGRVRLTNNDRWFLIQLYRPFRSILQILVIVETETLVRWQRAGFRYRKSLSRGGRPQIETDLRALTRRMSMENALWGAPHIYGELLKPGFSVAQSSVAAIEVGSMHEVKCRMRSAVIAMTLERTGCWIAGFSPGLADRAH